MFYIVFTEYDRAKNPSGDYFIPNSVCRYVGRSKNAALEAFKDYVDLAFSTSASYSGRTYFAGFDADLDFIKTFEEKVIEIPESDVTRTDILLFKNKLDIAVVSHTLRHSCYKFTKSIINTKCNFCNTETTLHKHKTAYGQYLCTDCWNSYLATAEGQVEYVIGLASGEYQIEAFSTEDRNLIVSAWNTHKERLSRTEEELLIIENAAKEAGLVFEIPEE